MTRIYAAKKIKRGLVARDKFDYADELFKQIAFMGWPVPEREYRFHKKRKWRADLAWPKEKIIIEIEGGVFSGGRHVRGEGFMRDMEKYNEATLLGFSIFRVVPSQVTSGEALLLVERIMMR